MEIFVPGDLVKRDADGPEMLIIGTDGRTSHDGQPDYFCVWEDEHFWYEEVFAAAELVLIRRERRKSSRHCIEGFRHF